MSDFDPKNKSSSRFCEMVPIVYSNIPSSHKTEKKQFNFFYSILLGEDENYAQAGTSHNQGGIGSSDTKHESKQPQGPELVTPRATYWLPNYLKRREQAPGYNRSESSFQVSLQKLKPALH